MDRAALFDVPEGLLHGGDYNPEQWLDRPDILEEDIRLMKLAGVNVVTLGVFSWSMYEPREGEYHFDWLVGIMDRLYENGVYTILATPSGARPAWLDAAYHEAMRMAASGWRDHHGFRHNHCMTSPAYRQKVREMDLRLAGAVKGHPGLILWHISNEFGGECYCDLCRQKFQEYLARKFDNDIDRLNHEWWTTFWSHRYNDFKQIEPPYENGERTVMGLNLEWRRFTSWNTTDFMKAEIETLRSVTPGIPVTTNFMRMFGGLDYYEMAEELDLVSWDSYPDWNNDRESLYRTAMKVAFDHSQMRSLKRGKPFLLMESVPSQVNWQRVNKLKRPGVHKLSCLQAVACGSDSVQYFQWRKSRGSYEQYHGAVVDHLGRSDTRVFSEVSEVGRILKEISGVRGSVVPASAAILFDWSDFWAISDMKGLSFDRRKYWETVREQYILLKELGVEADIVSPGEDLSRYDAVVAPMLYIVDEQIAENLKKYVQAGGALLATYLTGYVNENTLCHLGGFPGMGLTEVFGLYAEEIDALYPADRNGMKSDVLCGGQERTYEAVDYCEILKVQTARVLGTYTADFYEGTPLFTCNDYGQGKAYYVAARVENAGMKAIYRYLLRAAGVQTEELPEGIEHHVRKAEDREYHFYLNYTDEAVEIGGDGGVLRIPPLDALMVEKTILN